MWPNNVTLRDMGRLLKKLRTDSAAYTAEAEENGVVLVAREGMRGEFSDVVRDLLDSSGEDFVVFPTPDGNEGYERVFVLPLAPLDPDPSQANSRRNPQPRRGR